MRILVANKFWYRRGGLERVMFDEVEWLEAAGHEVAHFSTSHPDNEPSPWSGYFVPYLEIGPESALGAADKARAAVRMFSNGEAARRFARLVDEFRPDVVHVHGIHRQISPSVLAVARARGVPVVQTLHDYHHICPANVLLRPDGSVCDPRACGTLSYGAAVRYRCVQGSLAASALSAAETSFQRVRRIYERTIDRFIAPSRFLATLMADAGWRVPTTVVPNAVRPGACARADATAGFLYAGRLSPEKGVDVLLEAARAAGVAATIAGGGPIAWSLAERFSEARFTGHLTAEEVAALACDARAVVVPSVCFENAPMSVVEAMAVGVPVVASRLGGIPELLDDGVEGLLVPPGDVASLAAALGRLASDEALARSMGEAGRRRARRDFAPEVHLQRLLEVYDGVIAARRTS